MNMGNMNRLNKNIVCIIAICIFVATSSCNAKTNLQNPHEPELNGGRRKEYLDMHTKNNVSCFSTLKLCRKNKACWAAWADLHKVCTVSA